jgi:hypothetical protein
MAHFAQLDENNVVIQVIVINNSVVGDKFPESEPVGLSFISDNLKFPGVWKQASYNGNFRKKYPSIGDEYDEVNDVFITPQPYPSWTLDENFDWIPPVPKPNWPGIDNWRGMWIWNEDEQKWDPTDF